MSATKIKLLVSLVCVLFATQSYGVELKGSNYIGASFDSYHWGDDFTDEALGRTYGASIFGNYNFAPTWDLLISGSGAWDSEETTDIDISAYTAALGLNYLILPEEPYTFYLGGAVGLAHAHAKSNGTTLISETDPAFSAQAGVEWEMSESTILDASLVGAYVDTGVPNNNGSYGINLSFGFSPVEDLILYVSGGYVFEEEDAILSLGAIIPL